MDLVNNSDRAAVVHFRYSKPEGRLYNIPLQKRTGKPAPRLVQEQATTDRVEAGPGEKSSEGLQDLLQQLVSLRDGGDVELLRRGVDVVHLRPD